MKIGVTGGNGFIGKNLIQHLQRMEGLEVLTLVRSSSLNDLQEFIDTVDFVFHLAGVNRPECVDEFYQGNEVFTQQIVNLLQSSNKKTPILISSSIQVGIENDYGKSKLGSELALSEYSAKTGAPVYIYRLPNVFGKWSKPNYNTVIATWCYNLTRGLPIEVNDESAELDLVYIDCVVEHFVRHLDDSAKTGVMYEAVSPIFRERLGSIKNLLCQFVESRKNLLIPPVGRGFSRALYATYLSFLPKDDFSYKITGYRDDRGAFYEFLKTHDSGQFSISTSAPGVTRGNHYHNTKNEKFLVVKGKAIIRLRQIHGAEVIEYQVCGDKMEVVEMIPGYTHDITNIGDSEMILLLWANEAFDKSNPDTYFENVELTEQ